MAQAKKIPPEKKPLVAGTLKSPEFYRQKAVAKRFILTSAQNNTKVHKPFMAALTKMAEHTGAKMMISRFSYNMNGWQKITKDHTDGDEPLWWAAEVMKYVQNEPITIAPGLLFCADLDILPTAKDPLSGLDNYAGNNSMVVPHAKLHMRSYAGLLSGQAQRFAYTTGACTLRNYIDRRAGQIASYHHVYGALYVEVDDDGLWWVRQINAGDDGSFFDLDTYYSQLHPPMSLGDSYLEQLFPGAALVINLGDVHAEKIDPVVFKGAMNMLRFFNKHTTHVTIHDLLDFESRNHHNIKDQFFLAKQHFKGKLNTVKENFETAATALEEIQRASQNALMLIVRSNHDMAFDRWLKDFDGKYDPANASYYHWHMFRKYQSIEEGKEYDAFEYALEDAAITNNVDMSRWLHIREDDSYVVHEIELGLHGHLGPNGSKGSPKGYRQLGRKLNTGHTHSAGIIDGVWTAGVLASLSMGYNKGPSSWSHSHILTLPNGKRQMITQRGDKWRASHIQ